MGTHEWQALLPVAAWQQWAVKAGIALSLALLLSFGLPVLLAAPDVSIDPWHAATVVFLTAGSLYVSSLCDSGARAFAISAPVMLVVTLLVFRSTFAVTLHPLARPLVMSGVIALALWFAFQNHRSAGRDLRRVGWQVFWMAALPLLVAIIAWS